VRALKVIYVIWLREIKISFRERSRIFGMIGQPLLYLLIVGQGISSSVQLNGAPPGIDYMRFIYPGIIGMSVLFTSIYSAISIVWDREFGFLKEVLVAPVPRWGVAVGKIFGGSTVAMIQSFFIVVLAPVAGIPMTALLILQVLVLAFLISIAVTSLGVAIAAQMESMQGFQMLMNLLVMPLYFLSGAMFPVRLAPSWMQGLMIANPMTYGVDALRNLVFSGAPSLREAAAKAGLINWGLAHDVHLSLAAALALACAACISFSRAD
jgi:ABC-2 type transport system permease protein